jgi:putative hemolysin
MPKVLVAAAVALSALAAGCTQQQPAQPGSAQAANRGGVNVGSLSCTAAGGMGFVFGSSRTLDCLFTRTDGNSERYEGTIRRYGVDIGFTRESRIVWAVFAPGNIAQGSLAGEYGGPTAQGTVGVGAGANVLIGGSSNQFTLQPVSVEGSVGLNAAAGVAAVSLRKVP